MRVPQALVAVPVALVLGLTLAGPPAAADELSPPTLPGSHASPTGQANRAERAEAALAHVQALVSGQPGHGATHRSGEHGHRDLTIALRDLRIQMDALSAADKKEARSYLMRPGSGSDPYIQAALPQLKCSADICIHWTETGSDAPNGPGLDGSSATVPPFVQQTLDTIQQINDDYVAAGYRTPKRDGSIGGGSDKVDIYIGDIGDQGLYGFCSSDDPNDPSTSGDYSLWAYCALDDDYASAQFPTNTPIENMRVTAAHEYFHAVQFAYDAWEDGWILESTATWVEDEMFDAVDDNRNYFRNSPLRKPGIPLDYFDPENSLFHYGVWIWWRYLTEKYPAKVGKLPTLVRDVWNRLDGTPGAPDDYSTQGLTHVLGTRGTDLRKEFQLFSDANRHPRTVYSEGAAYPSAPAALTLGLSKAQPAKVAKGRVLHLSSATARFNPRELSQRDWKLRLTFDLPPTARGAAAVVTVYKRSGAIATSLVSLNSTGGGSKTVAFSSRTVKGVDAVLVNASARFACWQDDPTPFSCSGAPLDDNGTYKVTGRAFR